MASLARKISTDVLISAILNISPRIRGIVLLPVLTASLGVEEYGAYMQLLAVTTIGAIISSFSLTPGFVNFTQDVEEPSAQTYYAVLLFLACSTGLVGLLVSYNADLISQLTLSTSEYKFVFEWGGVLIPLMALTQLGRGYYRAQMKIKTGGLVQALRDYAQIGAILIAVFGLNVSLNGVVISYVLVELSFVLILQGIVIQDQGLTFPAISQIPEILDFSIWLTASTIASQISSRADRVMIGFFIGAGAVGIYSVAYGLSSLMMVLVAPIRNTFFPEFSRLIAEGKDKIVGEYTTTGIHLFLLFSVPAVIGLHFVSEPLIRYFATSAEATEAANLVPIIAIGILFYGLDRLIGVSLEAARLTRQVSLARSIAAMGNIVLNIVLISSVGIAGAALATVFSYAVSSVLLQLMLRQQFSFNLNLRKILGIGLATMGMAISLFLLPPVHVVLTVAIGVIVYLPLSLICGGIDLQEIQQVL